VLKRHNLIEMSSPSSTDAARRTAEARAAVTASLASVGASVDNDLRTRTADLHSNSEAITKQEKELAKQTKALAKESAQWEKLLNGGTKKLNEVGDIQNWAEMIERDLLVLEETVRLVDGKETEETASGTGRW
jgi:K+-sensing histidine kinase KdpD